MKWFKHLADWFRGRKKEQVQHTEETPSQTHQNDAGAVKRVRRPRHSSAKIKRAKQLYDAGKGYKQIAEKLNLSENTVYAWVKKGFHVGSVARDEKKKKFKEALKTNDFKRACEIAGVHPATAKHWTHKPKRAAKQPKGRKE